MATRRDFLYQGARLSAAALLTPLAGCATGTATSVVIGAVPVPVPESAPPSAGAALAGTFAPRPAQTGAPPSARLAPPPDIFDAQALDVDFWLKPRVLNVVRSASGERAKLLYWKDGHIINSAYEQLCHLMRDVHGKQSAPIDPKLFETLWGTQAFVARFGMTQPLEILSGYRTLASNKKLIEQGIPAARQSLHMQGRAADIRIARLNAEVLGGLIRSFRQGGVGFYYRAGTNGGWIHADTGLNRTWKG